MTAYILVQCRIPGCMIAYKCFALQNMEQVLGRTLDTALRHHISHQHAHVVLSTARSCFISLSFSPSLSPSPSLPSPSLPLNLCEGH